MSARARGGRNDFAAAIVATVDGRAERRCAGSQHRGRSTVWPCWEGDSGGERIRSGRWAREYVEARAVIRGAADQDEAAEVAAVRLEQHRLEALDFAARLQFGVQGDRLKGSSACCSRARAGCPNPTKSPVSAIVRSPPIVVAAVPDQPPPVNAARRSRRDCTPSVANARPRCQLSGSSSSSMSTARRRLPTSERRLPHLNGKRACRESRKRRRYGLSR